MFQKGNFLVFHNKQVTIKLLKKQFEEMSSKNICQIAFACFPAIK